MKIGYTFIFVIFSFFCVNYCKGQEEACDCTIYYLCDAADTVTSSKCQGSEVCCRPPGPTQSPIVTAPMRVPTTQRSGLPKDVTEAPTQTSNCDCVPSIECPEVSGANKLDVRFGSCQANQVCCPRRDGGLNEGGNNPQTGGGGNNPPIGDGGGSDIDLEGCGIRRPSNEQITSFRISSNSEASQTFFGEFPWMMAILINRVEPDGSVSEDVFQCGATLILPNVVMTAAHCVNNIAIGDIKVRGGDWDSSNVNDTRREPLPYQERTVSQVFIHDKFDAASIYNDIALLILDFAFPIKDNIRQICTPNSAEEYDPNDCLVTGWGKDKFGVSGQYAKTLRKVDLKIVPRDICQKKLRQTRLGPAFVLHESVLCAAGEPQQDACKGDGGGPLICSLKNDRERYTQVGIVAWGIGCGSDTPGVYVDVLRFKKWILENSNGQVLDKRFKAPTPSKKKI